MYDSTTGYELKIVGGQEQPNLQVLMHHNQEYSLYLANRNSYLACSIKIEIDGKEIGTFQLPAGGSGEVSHPVDSDRRFVFVRIGTTQAQAGELFNVDRNKQGLVSAMFIPEKGVRQNGMKGGMFDAADKYDGLDETELRRGKQKSIGAGGTVLGAHTHHQYDRARTELDLDFDRAFTIHLRMVAIDDEPAIVPLRSERRSNPVPPVA